MRRNRLQWLLVLLWSSAAWVAAGGQQPVARIALIPPSPVTDKITLDIRGAVENTSNRSRQFTLALYLDGDSDVYKRQVRGLVVASFPRANSCAASTGLRGPSGTR